MNIALLLDLIADTFPDRVALTGADDELTYDDLRQSARALATRLGEGATLAFADVSSPAVPVALFGAAWAGAAYAPLNFRLPPESLLAQIERLDDPRVVTSERLTADLGVVDPTSSKEWFADLRSPGDLTESYHPEPGAPAVILFTSGSTGTPKAALLTHDNLLAYVLETVEFASAEPDDAIMLAAPPFHIAGVASVLSSIYSGRRILPVAAFTAEGWLDQAAQQRATHAFLVPTMLSRIVAAMEADAALRVPSLRAISYGGARMAAPTLERALELFPNVDFVNAYGLTETSSTIAVLGPDDHRSAMSSDDPSVRQRLGSAGRPLAGVEVAIVDESGTATAVGTSGLIRVRGAQVGGNYLDSASSLDADGWLVTGDVGHVDDDGYLFVEGRMDDVIIKGGENLSPSEIEDTLLRHPVVVSVAVVGVPDPEWGETVGAAVTVVGDSGPEVAAELTAWVKEHLGSLKAPTRIDVVDELPHTATGKILRREVRDRFAGGGS